ncbi:MAG: endonuclease V [Deltaproteobacteria bacterium]|jgi:deoxyribonuclease V|nr:endonuclease V [Deltaproteobacteria bacterium]
MLACTDVHYYNDHAVAACILFKKWTDSIPVAQLHTTISKIAPYTPGQFYLRELPCILKVLDLVTENLEIILIDGYVWLDSYQSPGLGAHLYEALSRNTPIIGIAKNQFKKSDVAAEIKRGKSDRPLYVTSAGINQQYAANCIAKMHGKFRIPTLLKKVDQLSKNINYK